MLLLPEACVRVPGQTLHHFHQKARREVFVRLPQLLLEKFPGHRVALSRLALRGLFRFRLETWTICCHSTSPRRFLFEQSSLIVDRQSRSEEHTSELQSLAYLVCPLLLFK